MERGAKPSPLDHMSMAEWLARERFDSPTLRWYINYACRDDYGALAKDTSAWAGVQYFASREPEEKGPLTWPEGNGWIARQLLEKLGRYVRTGSVVYHIRRDGARLRVLTEQTEYIADAVIFAAPTFLAPYLIEDAPRADGFEYSPWLTANLTLDRMPREKGLELAWDNVIYDSPTLGYVDATHMSAGDAHRADGVDVLLVARRIQSRGRATTAARQGLELLERSDPARPRARASRHPAVRLAHRHHAAGPRDGAAEAGLHVLRTSASAGPSRSAASSSRTPT